MPAAVLAQPLALSTPKTNAQLPFPMFVNGNEISSVGGVATSHKIRDAGFSGNAELTFTIEDRANTIAPWLAKQQRVIWSDAVNNRLLFQGFVSDFVIRPVGPWPEIDVVVTHISCVLDYAQPIVAHENGSRGPKDQSMIQFALAYFCQEPNVGAGGWVQVLNAAMPASLMSNRTTLRNCIDQILAATGVQGAVAYLDNLGNLHTMAIGDINAPYTISDTPNLTTSVPAAIEYEDSGAEDVDALYVYGGTAAGSGAVYAWQCGISAVATSPLRWATLDAPEAQDRATMLAAAKVEFQRRQFVTRATIVVTGFDGWAKGQLLTITNAVLGWSGKQLTIASVNMETLSGTGIHRYTITAGSDPVLFTSRIKLVHAAWRYAAPMAGRITGAIGGTGLA